MARKAGNESRPHNRLPASRPATEHQQASTPRYQEQHWTNGRKATKDNQEAKGKKQANTYLAVGLGGHEQREVGHEQELDLQKIHFAARDAADLIRIITTTQRRDTGELAPAESESTITGRCKAQCEGSKRPAQRDSPVLKRLGITRESSNPAAERFTSRRLEKRVDGPWRNTHC